jgi:hypothetical protein
VARAVAIAGVLVALVAGAAWWATRSPAAETSATAPAPDTCPEAGGDAAIAPPISFPHARLAPEQRAALDALAAESQPLACGAIAGGHQGGHGSDHHGSDHHGGADASRHPAADPLAPADQQRFDEQWAAAVAGAAALATPELAAAAGYVRASPHAAGVGAHWVSWPLLARPFDAARPSMLLFDERPGREPSLAGFSYWVRSDGGAPDGFAGEADQWHRHQGLCFVDGWLLREDVPAADACAGAWLDGGDLWMLHAWVVPSVPNGEGPFAGRNPALCPADREQIPDALRCDPVGR